MKKNILILCMLGASALAANGQTLLKGIKFTDNWSVGINGGVTTPMTHCSFWKNSRPAVGIELSKSDNTSSEPGDFSHGVYQYKQ